MRAVGTQLTRGDAPWTPEDRALADNVIKFRVREEDKLLFAKAAAAADMTLSSYLRRAGRMAVTGRMTTRPMLAEAAHMRRLANSLAMMAESKEVDPERFAALAKSIAGEIHAIASRRLNQAVP